MNNACPKCGTVYNVTAAAIGRKISCKNCGAKLVVTDRGLEPQDAMAAAPPPPPAPAGGPAFDFDEDRGRDRDEESRKPAKASSRRSSRGGGDDGDGDDNDWADSGPPKRRGPKGKNFLVDFLFFREFITPWLVKILFWIFIGLLLLGALVFFVISLASGKAEAILLSFVAIIVFVPVYMLLLRIYFELILLGFAVYDRLGEIRDLLQKRE